MRRLLIVAGAATMVAGVGAVGLWWLGSRLVKPVIPWPFAAH